jgi:stringent starvation protein B
MSEAAAPNEWPPWTQAGLFFVLAFGGIQGVSAVLQNAITLPALVSATIAALTGAGIVYGYESKRQAGGFEEKASSNDASDADREDQADPESRSASETDTSDETTPSAPEASST